VIIFQLRITEYFDRTGKEKNDKKNNPQKGEIVSLPLILTKIRQL